MRRYVRWYEEGHLSSNGYCFDIGNTTREALLRFIETGEAYAGSTYPFSAGNGSLMRLAPVPMYFAQCTEDAVALSGNSSRTTHGALEAVDACRYFGGLLVGALNGEHKETLLGDHYCPTPEYWSHHPIADKIAEIADGHSSGRVRLKSVARDMSWNRWRLRFGHSTDRRPSEKALFWPPTWATTRTRQRQFTDRLPAHTTESSLFLLNGDPN